MFDFMIISDTREAGEILLPLFISSFLKKSIPPIRFWSMISFLFKNAPKTRFWPLLLSVLVNLFAPTVFRCSLTDGLGKPGRHTDSDEPKERQEPCLPLSIARQMDPRVVVWSGFWPPCSGSE